MVPFTSVGHRLKHHSHSPSLAVSAATVSDHSKAVSKALAVCAVFILLHALAVIFRSESPFHYDVLSRIWGIDNIVYYPLSVILAFYVMLLLVCVPKINRGLLNSLDHFIARIDKSGLLQKRWKKVVLLIFLAAIFLTIFRLFHIKYNFLGDMNIRVRQMENQEYQYTEYATMWSLHLVYDWLHRWFGIRGIQVFQWSSNLFGVLAVCVSFFLADQLGKNAFQKAVLFIFTIACGTLQFFFGYAEIYPFPALTVFLYLLSGVLYSKGKVGVIIPILGFLLAVAAHLLSVVFLPSLLFLNIYRHPKVQKVLQKATLRHLVLLVLLAVPAAYWILPMAGQGYYLMAWSRTIDSSTTTTLLSSEHIWEFLNSQLLAAGSGFVLLILVIFRFLVTGKSLDPTEWFLAITSLFAVLSAFITNAVRGSGDWDILAFPSIAYNVWAMSAYLSHVQTKTEAAKVKSVVIVLLLFNMLSASLWIGINASDRSIKKIESMLTGDPGNYYRETLPTEMSLAFNLEANGLQQESLQYFRIAYERYPRDPRAYYNYATRLLEIQQDSLAFTILEKLVDNFPGYARAYEALIAHYAQRENYQALYRVVVRLFNGYLQNPNYYKSVIPSANLVNWFSYLLQVETANKNQQAVQLIQQQLAQLK